MTNINDKPSLYDDQLNYRKYAKALAKVIKDADTPFTIGVSWEWGYWKTTLMYLIAYYLDKNYYDEKKVHIKSKLNSDIISFNRSIWIRKWDYNVIMLNTWPFINSKDIWENIFEQIMYELVEIINKSSRLKNIKWLLLRAIKSVKINWKLKFGIWEVWVNIDPSEFKNPYINFKLEVEYILNEITEKLWKLIIFIDDLDRLYPKQALEVILFIKNFLDVKKCIFVIWTDNDILKEWLEELYWKYWDNKNDNEGKKDKEKYLDKIKNDFFEKIYQLEFRIPNLLLDNITDYINALIEDKFIEKDLNELKEYLWKNVDNLNPRKLKKIFNTYNLVKNIIWFELENIDNDLYKSKINRIIFELATIYTLNIELFNSLKKKWIWNIDNKLISSFLKSIEWEKIFRDILFSFWVNELLYDPNEVIKLLNEGDFNLLLQDENKLSFVVNYLLYSDNQSLINKFVEYIYDNVYDKLLSIRPLIVKYSWTKVPNNEINNILNL